MNNKAIFLDRDGVINIEKEYLHKKQDFEFLPTVLETCRQLKKLGYLLVVITNQSGIARGFYSHDDFDNLTIWMEGEFSKAGASLDAVYYCPHHPSYSGDCKCRKPSPGMILQAVQDLDINLADSLLAGDKESDIKAGINAGITKNFLLKTGHKVDTVNTKATAILNSLNEILSYC